MNIRCLLFKHDPILVIDEFRLADDFIFGEFVSIGAVIEESHQECKRCGKVL